MFHDLGLSKRQGSKVLESIYGFSADVQKKQKAEMEKVSTANMEWLRSNYGDEFDSKMTVMQAALAKFGSRELAGLIEETSYNPALIDLLVRVGDTLKSDSLVTGLGAPLSTNSPGAALKEIKRLESDQEFMVKLGNKSHAGHSEAVGRMEELYKIAYDIVS
jgi:hypothetical protein